MKLEKKWMLYVALSIVTLTVVAVVSDWAGVSKYFTKLDLNNYNFIGKSAWDWLSLLGVPFSLAILGYWFQKLQKRRDDSKDREQRNQTEERAKEEILQDYFDRLSGVLIDKNIIAISAEVESATSTEDTHQGIDDAVNKQIKLLETVSDVIRARTLSILRRFENDGRRKGSIIQFLSESEVINKLTLNLSGADLSGADLRQFDLHDTHLSGVNLRGANLGGANLRGADLSKVNLHGADLSGAALFNSILHDADLGSADLRSSSLSGTNLCDANLVGASLHGADLSNSKLSGAKLCEAKLYGANLCKADLRGAKLCEAKLRGANLYGTNLGGVDFSLANVRDAKFDEADLSGADLSKVEELTKDQLQNAFLCKTILPFHDIKPDRDCERLAINAELDYLIVETSPNLVVPDNAPLGIVCGVDVSGVSHKVKDIEVSVDITHTYISDLKVSVISPEGIEVKLHDHSGSSAPNIVKTYTIETTPELHRFIGEFAQGEWKLKIADIGGRDVGSLNHFLLKILKSKK